MIYRYFIIVCLLSFLLPTYSARAALDLPVEDGDVLSSRILPPGALLDLQNILKKRLDSRVSTRAPMPKSLFAVAKPESESPLGNKVTAEWSEAMRLYRQNRFPETAALLKRIQPKLPSPRARFEAGLLWCRALLAEGKAAEAERLIIDLEQEERDGWGWNILSLAMRGELRTWMGDWPAAKADLETVAQAIGDWQIPVSYFFPPSNLPEGVAVALAQIQSATSLAALHIMTNNPDAGSFWAQYADARLNDVFYLANHDLYGRYFRLPQDAAWGRALNLLFLATASEITGNAKPALYDAAEQAFDAWNYQPGKVITGTFRSWAALQSGASQRAIDLADKTAAYAAELGQPDLIWQVQGHVGKAWLDLGNSEQAEQAFLQAQAAIDLVSGNLSSDRVKIRFGSGKEDITRHLAWLALERGDHALALSRLEQGRARAFMDMLAHHPVNRDAAPSLAAAIDDIDAQIRAERFRRLTGANKTTSNTAFVDTEQKAERREVTEELEKAKTALKKWNYDSLDEEMKQRVKPLVSRIRYLEKKLAELPAPQPAAPVEQAPSTDPAHLETLLAARQQLIEDITLTAPDLASIYNARSASLAEIQQALPVDTELLYVLPNNDAGEQHYLLISANDSRLLSGTSNSAEWEKLLRMFSDAVARQDAPKQDDIVAQMTGALPPDLLTRKATLYVVPSGPMFFLPWGALTLDRPIVSLPNASWLLRQKVAVKTDHAVIVGDPAFGGKLAQLPGARAESRAVSSLLAQPLLEGQAAQEQALRKAIGDGTDILHLATHGLFRARRPLQSSIVLSDGESAHYLTAATLFSQPLKARMVILSACETGLGHRIAGEDFLGLSRSLFLGGTETILSSLWPIDDAGTKDYMTAFHLALRQGETAATAWQNARNRLRDSGYPPAVYGAFILSGNGG